MEPFSNTWNNFNSILQPPNFSLTMDGVPLPIPQNLERAELLHVFAYELSQIVPRYNSERKVLRDFKDRVIRLALSMSPNDRPPLPLPVDVLMHIFTYVSMDEKPPVREINRWCRKNIPVCKVTPKLAQIAARCGATSLLEWVIPFIPIEKRAGPVGFAICKEAAAGGHLRTYQIAHMHLHQRSSEIFLEAAKGGHLSILEYMRELNFSYHDDADIEAASKGHLEAFQWLRRKRPCNEPKIYAAAARAGQLHILEWGLRNDCLKGYADAFIWNEGALNRHLPVVEWAHANGLKWTGMGTFVSAAIGGSTEILQFLLDKKCPTSKWICLFAIENGHLEALRWAIKSGIPFDRAELVAKAQNRPAILQWIQENIPETV